MNVFDNDLCLLCNTKDIKDIKDIISLSLSNNSLVFLLSIQSVILIYHLGEYFGLASSFWSNGFHLYIAVQLAP